MPDPDQMTEVVVDLSAGTLLSLASSSERRPGPGYREAVYGIFLLCEDAKTDS